MSKRKWFTKVLYTAFALALVAGISLVPATPVSAATSVSEPEVTVSPSTQLTIAEYTIEFNATTALAAGTGTITIDFTDYEASGGIVPPIGDGDGNAGDYSTGDVTINGAPLPWTYIIAVDVQADQVQITTPVAIAGGDTVTVVFETSAGITNPLASATQTLEVWTSADATPVTSTAYIIAGLPGKDVTLYTDEDEFVNSYDTIAAALAAASADYTIEVGPGTYEPSSTLTINVAGLTLKGANYGVNPVTETRGAESIIDATTINAGVGAGEGVAIRILNSDVTVEGFTVADSSGSGILIEFITVSTNTEGVTIRNNIISDTGNNGVCLAAKASGGAVVVETTISGNLIEDCNSGICVLGGAKDLTISNNMITGSVWDFDGAIVFDQDNDNNTISGNILTDNLGSGIVWDEGTTSDNNLVEGNTISGNAGKGIWVWADAPTELVIIGNDITDNEGVGILVESWTAASDVIKFNDITGNDTTDGYGLQNSSGGTVDATHNWWGTTVASEIAAMINDVTSSDVTTYDPWLGAEVSAAEIATDVSFLDAQDTVGVEVSGATATGTGQIIRVARYTENPEEPPEFTPISFFDVYVSGADTAAQIVIKFYDPAITSESVAYVWSELDGVWLECDDQYYNPVAEYLRVKVRDDTIPNIAELTGTPFAISGEAAEFDPSIYDVDDSGVIEIDELLDAIGDYIGGTITISQLLDVIGLYITG